MRRFGGILKVFEALKIPRAYSSFFESGRDDLAKEIFLEIFKTSFISSGFKSIDKAGRLITRSEITQKIALFNFLTEKFIKSMPVKLQPWGRK
jgi:hypothetical protein